VVVLVVVVFGGGVGGVGGDSDAVCDVGDGLWCW